MKMADEFEICAGAKVLRVGAADLGGDPVSFLDHLIAIVRGELAGLQTDLDLLGIRRRQKGLRLEFLRGSIHHRRPHRQDGVRAESPGIDRAALVEPRPNDAGDLGGVTDEPVVRGIVFGAGLAGDGVIAQVKLLQGLPGGAELERIGEDAVDLVGGVAVDHLGVVHPDIRGVDDIAEAVADVGDDVRFFGAATTVREDRVGEAEFLERAWIASEEGRVELLQITREGHAGFLRQLHDRVDPGLLTDAHGRGVLTLGEGHARGDDVFVDIVQGFHAPLPENAGGAADHHLPRVHGCVINEGPREKTCFKGRRVDKGHEGRASRSPSLRDAVEHAVVEIPATDPGEN